MPAVGPSRTFKPNAPGLSALCDTTPTTEPPPETDVTVGNNVGHHDPRGVRHVEDHGVGDQRAAAQGGCAVHHRDVRRDMPDATPYQ